MGELVFEFRQLAGHGADLTELIRDLGDLIGDHLGSLDRAGDGPEDGFGRLGVDQNQNRNQEGGKDSVMHDVLLSFHCRVPARGTRTSDVNQMRRRWPARMVMVGRRFRNRSRMAMAP